MRREVDSTNEIRCFCRRKPLLAKWGIDSNGDAFLHLKVYKQKRLYAEALVHSGSLIRLRCRECLRWTRISVKHQPYSKVIDLPEAIPTVPA